MCLDKMARKGERNGRQERQRGKGEAGKGEGKGKCSPGNTALGIQKEKYSSEQQPWLERNAGSCI